MLKDIKRIHLSAQLISVALSITMGMQIFSVWDQSDVRADGFVKDISNTYLAEASLGSPKAPESMDSPWTGSYVWYGKYDGLPVRYRVLSPRTDIYGSETMFLDCDNDLYATTMDDDDVLNEGATAFNDWAHCDINIDLNGDKLLYKENCFTEAERNAIASSKISSHEYVVGNNAFEVPQGIKYYFGSGSTPLTGEKLFILDAEDIVNSAYGYYSSMGAGENRVKYVFDSNSPMFWWFRSPNGTDSLGKVRYQGDIYVTNHKGSLRVSPAMNISLDDVLFSSVVKSGDENRYGSESKLTIIDKSIEFSIPDAKKITSANGTIKIPFSAKGNYDRITVMITDKKYTQDSAHIVYLDEVKVKSSVAEFTLPESLDPAKWGSQYYVYAFAEDLNDIHETDYVSKPVLIACPNAQYNIKVTVQGKGTASASVTSGTTGTKVTLKGTPEKGYALTDWKIVSGDVTVDNNDEFVIGNSDVEIQAVFTMIKTNPPRPKPTATPVPSSKPSSGATPTVTAAPAKPTSDPEEGKTAPKAQILAFVERIYTYVLDREPEEEGAAFWSEELWSFRRTGAEVAQGFIFSPEFENRKTTDEQFVTILYKTFFGRDPEEEGMNFWLNQLATGTMDRVTVANGFIYSQEWADTCASYGIRSGGDIKPSGTIEPTDLTYAFVERMYTTAMGRGYDEEGKQYWASALANFEITGEGVGASFFLSDEMNGFNLSDKDFLGRLYATFMDREADADGETYWLGLMASGTPRADIVLGFTRSPEFMDKCIEARILPY